ncbi:hypothetical protein [Pseudomonas sp. NA-150]|uniref:hypothetical protein n=1 Tax=Pseudomonas sp. NA-150 TaxID=3367525 RepID=UPI0037CAB59D
MIMLKLDDRCRQLLAAQANLGGTFNHAYECGQNRRPLSFRLIVERNTPNTVFTVEMGNQRHSITLPQGKKNTPWRLAAFIEEIANGQIDAGTAAETLPPDAPRGPQSRMTSEQEQRLLELVRKGGLLSLEMGFEQPIHVAIHRTQSRTGITTIMSIGERRPRTKCFTVYGQPVEVYPRLVESINHLADAATPAAQAA